MDDLESLRLEVIELRETNNKLRGVISSRELLLSERVSVLEKAILGIRKTFMPQSDSQAIWWNKEVAPLFKQEG